METSGPTSGILNAETTDGELDDIAEEDGEEEEDMSDEEVKEEEKDKEVSSMFFSWNLQGCSILERFLVLILGLTKMVVK